MRKFQEISDPFSCFSKAKKNELMFVLLARDITAPSVIRYWVDQRILAGKNLSTDPQIAEALKCAAQMEEEVR
jgi:hypothetical protein